MNLALPLLLVLSLGPLAWRRHGPAVAWAVVGLAGIALLAPALALPHGIPSPSATLAGLPPWQGTGDPAPGNANLADVTFQVEPWLLYLRGELRAGRLPFWNPHQSSGAPYWSNGSSAPLFPLHLLFAALPLELGFVLLAWIRILLGGLGCWRLARELELSQEAALLAAVVFPLSGRLASFLLFPMANALCLVPWVFLAVERLARGKSGWCLLAATGGLQLLAGHPETPFFTALAAGLYLLVRGSQRFVAAWGRFASAWLVAGAGAAVHLLPLAMTLPATDRWQQWQPGEPTPLGALLAVLLRFVLPNAFGHAGDGSWWGPFNFTSTTVYAGALTLPLAAAGAAAARGDRRFRALVVMVVVCLAAALHAPGMRQLLLAVPVLQKGLHHYLLLAVALGLALLAGAGLDRWRHGRGRGTLVGAVAVAAALGAAWWAWAGDWRAHGQTALQGGWTAAVLGLGAALAASLLLPAATRRRLAPALLLVTVADLAVAHAPSNPGLPLDRLYPQTGAVAFLAGRPERVAAPGLVLRPNAAMVYGLYDVRGDDSLKLKRYEEVYARHLGRGHPTFFRPITRWDSPWLDRLGVRWVVTGPRSPALAPGWKLAYRGADARVWERPTARPLVRFAPPSPGAELEVVERHPGLWRLGWRAPAATRLVVAETWAPGWRGGLDGAPVPVEAVDGLFLGVEVGPGSGTLTLRYRPAGIGWGALASLLAWVAIAVARWLPR